VVIVTKDEERARIGESFEYNPDDGKVSWKKCFHTQYVGKEAGTLIEGYRVVCFGYKNYKTSRLAWMLYYGEWPAGIIDHINGIRDDNRIVNLRDVTQRENMLNKQMHRDGREPGLRKVKRGMYEAGIKIKGEYVYLGQYKASHEASMAYIAAFNRLMGEAKK